MKSEAWFHMNGPLLEGARVWIDRAEAKHALGSRRLAAGDEVCVFDGQGRVAAGTIAAQRRDDGALGVDLGTSTLRPTPIPHIHLACAIPKGDRVATLLESAAAMAAASVTPLDCERSVVRFTEALRSRYERLMGETCKQARQPSIPLLLPASPPLRWVQERTGQGVPVLLADSGGKPPILPFPSESVALVIGPEGGFTSEERGEMIACGAVPVALGAATLRVELAATVGLALLRIPRIG